MLNDHEYARIVAALPVSDDGDLCDARGCLDPATVVQLVEGDPIMVCELCARKHAQWCLACGAVTLAGNGFCPDHQAYAD